MLELNLIIDLKKNLFQKFDQIIEVDSIWNLNNVSEDYKNINNIQEKCILILQNDSSAAFFDFGILDKGENLILFQCKKALKRKPKNIPTKILIYNNKEVITDNFKNKFKTKIKNIYLSFITGISFYYQNGELKYKTWGNKENKSFQLIEKISAKEDALLLYYDVIEKKIYYKENLKRNTFNNVGELISFIELLNPVKIDENIESLSLEERNKYLLESLSYKEANDILERYKNYRQKLPDEKFLTIKNKSISSKSGYEIKGDIIGVCDNPKERDLYYKNLFIGIKTKRANYLTVSNDKKRKTFEIKPDEIFEVNKSIESLFKEEIEQCYYYENLK